MSCIVIQKHDLQRMFFLRDCCNRLPLTLNTILRRLTGECLKNSFRLISSFIRYIIIVCNCNELRMRKDVEISDKFIAGQSGANVVHTD